MDRITLDFEKNTIEWDTDTQKGAETCEDLKERKPLILAAMGYGEIDITNTVRTAEDFLSGKISREEMTRIFEEEAESEKGNL